MYKKTGQSAHYLPRMASYSTHPKRNGRVDVLPPNAGDQLYSIANQIEDGRKRIEDLSQQRAPLSEELHSLENVKSLQSRHSQRLSASPRGTQLRNQIATIDAEIKRIRRHIGSLSALLGSTREMTFEAAFVQIARLELADDAWQTISKKAHAITQRIRGDKQ